MKRFLKHIHPQPVDKSHAGSTRTNIIFTLFICLFIINLFFYFYDRQVTLFEEFMLLKEFEKRENSFANKVNTKLREKDEMQEKVKRTQIISRNKLLRYKYSESVWS